LIEWIVKEHPDFFKDLDKLDKRELEIFYKKKAKDKTKPSAIKASFWRGELLQRRNYFKYQACLLCKKQHNLVINYRQT